MIQLNSWRSIFLLSISDTALEHITAQRVNTAVLITTAISTTKNRVTTERSKTYAVSILSHHIVKAQQQGQERRRSAHLEVMHIFSKR